MRVEEEIRLARDRAEMLGELQVNMCFRRGIASKFQRPSMLVHDRKKMCQNCPSNQISIIIKSTLDYFKQSTVLSLNES